MSIYYNPTTKQTATTKDDKADENGNICVRIDGASSKPMNYHQFIQDFYSMAVEKQHERHNNE